MRTKGMKNISFKTELSSIKFYLAILVVFVHMTSRGWICNDTELEDSVYLFVENEIMPFLTVISIPGFFMISGFLFFHNFKTWHWATYGQKIKRRIGTLLVPFVIWNLMKYLSLAATAFPTSGWTSFANVMNEYGWWRIFWDGGKELASPILLSTWFLRDLMVYSLVTPAVYFLMKKTRGWLMLPLAICAILDIWPTTNICNGLNTLAFCSGCWLSLTGKDLMGEAWQYRWLLLATAVVFRLLMICERDLFWVPYIFAALACLFNICRLAENHGMRLPERVANSSMMVYLGHSFLTLSAVTMTVCHLIPYPGDWLSVLRYFLIPSLTIAILVVAYNIIMRYAPCIARLLLGGR